MKIIIKTIACLSLYIICNIAGASGGGTAWGKITLLYDNVNWTMVQVSGVTDNPDGCSQVDYYALNQTDINYATLHGTLLAAQLANKDVKFWVNGCGGQSNTRPHIMSVLVK